MLALEQWAEKRPFSAVGGRPTASTPLGFDPPWLRACDVVCVT